MDYKSLYLCADDSEEMPGFGDIRNTEFSYNQPYASLQSEDETKGAKLEPDDQQKFCKPDELDDKPFLYNDQMPKMEKDLKYAFNDAPQLPDDGFKDGPSSASKINGLANFVATKFVFEQTSENRVNEFDSKGFPFCLDGVSSNEHKLSSEDPELYDDETEEEEEDNKDLKTEHQGSSSDAANRDDLDRNFDSASEEYDEDNDDDETDVEKQTWNTEITDDQLQRDEEEDCRKEQQVQEQEENCSEEPNQENPLEEGSSNVVKKKKKSRSRKQGEGDPKTRKKRKRRRKEREEPSEKKAKLDASRKNLFERKNIRKIFEEENLDEETKAAQKEEMERKQRLLEIQEKLKQQALELRAQREKDMAANLHPDASHKRVDLATSSLKSLLEDKSDSSDSNSILDSNKPALVAEQPVVTDVVEISSSENEDNNDDDDDDLIVMSDAEEEPEEEEGGDAESSGSHVNDAMNRPDVNGCVLVNVGHPPDEPDIFLAPQLASAVKPHQIGGIRFMYDNVVESLERYKTNNGFGCILAHSMGLGKTIQVVSFVDIFLRHTGAKSVLIIVPVNTLQNWVNEFNMWMPVVDEDSQMGGGIDKEIFWPREFKLYVINDNMKTTNSRTKIVADWHETGGVLLLGYEMYRLLIKSKGLPVKSRRNTKKSSASSEPVIIDVEEEEFNKEIVKNLQEALVRPGPDLVVCDEGHRIKNSHASISQVLKNIRTRRRIVLTGYPLQNNLLEYWCMVDFVRPNYLGSKQEFCNMFERPIMNGQCADSTPKDVKLMRFRAHVLHSLLEGFVQRRGHTVLQSALPQKEEYVIFVRLSPIQRKLYNEFMSAIRDSGNIASWSNSNNPIKAFSVCCKIWNHPDILYQVVEQRKDDNDLDLEEAKVANSDVMQSAGTGGPAPTQKRAYRRGAKLTAASNNNNNSGNSNSQAIMNSMTSNGGIVDGEGKNGEDGGEGNKEGGGTGLVPATNEKKESQVISYEWAVDLMKDYLAGMAEHSGKMVILMDIIDESVRVGDKILVFSQSLYTLTLIEEYLSRRSPPGMDEYWQKNRNYYRLDGGTAGIDREKLINQFNDYNNSKVHLFLLSTRAGCLGINLIGACRVVIFDASWNPCHDCQAVCRVYRYGQNKCCYVYRLVSDNTMEKNIYDRQINKQGISDRVVDELNPQNLLSKKQVDVLMRNEESEPSEITLERYEERCGDSLLVNVVKKNSKWLTKEPFTHESLLLDRKDQKLTRHEKRLAKQGYEMEKKMSTMGFSRQSSLYPKTIDGVAMVRFGQRPVASVRPMMSAPIKGGPNPRIISNQFRAPGLKPGVSVQQIQTTTDIIIPGTNTISDSTNSKIPAGEKVLVIKTPKGVYIRTSHGKIFAVRTAPKPGATPGGSAAATGATSSSVSVAGTSGATVLTMTPARKGVIPSTGIQAEDAMEVDDDDDDIVEVWPDAHQVFCSPFQFQETDAAGKSTSQNVSLTTATTVTTASATTVTSTSTINNIKDLSINKDKVISAPVQRGTSLLRHQDQSSNNQQQQATSKNFQPSQQQHHGTAQSQSVSTAIMASSSNLVQSTSGKPSDKEYFSSNQASTTPVSTKTVGAPPPVKTVLPMQNNSRNFKKTKDKSESSFSGSGNLGGSKEAGSIVPVNPQPILKPVAQPQPVTNTAAQQMQQQNSFFDWNRKPLKDFEAPSLFGLQTSSSGHLGSLDGGMGDLLPGYLKSNNSSGLPPPPFFSRPSASSSSSTSLFGMTSPVSSAPSMGKAFPLNSPSPGQQDRSTSSSNKGLSAMMGSFSSPSSSSSSLHHPVPMTPPSYLPHGINPYGIANPYSWMPNPMWMGASPMDVTHHPPHFPHDPSAYGNPSATPEDFGSGSVNQGSNDLLGLDGFGGFPASFDDRSFSSLLMGDEDGSGNSNQGGGRRSGNRGAIPNPAYRQNPMAYPHPSAMGGYPYHNPYSPYGMPPHQPTGYYGPGANHSSSGGNMMARGGYISPSMHYPQHPGGFMQSPYDFTGGSRGLIQGSSSSSSSSASTKKGNFDVMKGD